MTKEFSLSVLTQGLSSIQNNTVSDNRSFQETPSSQPRSVQHHSNVYQSADRQSNKGALDISLESSDDGEISDEQEVIGQRENHQVSRMDGSSTPETRVSSIRSSSAGRGYRLTSHSRSCDNGSGNRISVQPESGVSAGSIDYILNNDHTKSRITFRAISHSDITNCLLDGDFIEQNDPEKYPSTNKISDGVTVLCLKSDADALL